MLCRVEGRHVYYIIHNMCTTSYTTCVEWKVNVYYIIIPLPFYICKQEVISAAFKQYCPSFQVFSHFRTRTTKINREQQPKRYYLYLKAKLDF